MPQYHSQPTSPRNGSSQAASGPTPTPPPAAAYQLTTCRATTHGCRNAVAATDTLLTAVRQILDASALAGHLRQTIHGPPLPHHRFKVAIAACPNACSQPQIKDVGIIAQAVPQQAPDHQDCTHCKLCMGVCKEQAIQLGATGPCIDRQACVNCAACASICPTAAIDIRQRAWRLLLGGKLGRHPRLAQEVLALASTAAVLEALRSYLAQFIIDKKSRQTTTVDAQMSANRNP